MIAMSNESHLLVEEYFYTVPDSFWSRHTVKYVKTAIHSLKTLNMFTHGPGHCLNTTPAIQLEILNLWESSGRHERTWLKCNVSPRFSLRIYGFSNDAADNTLKVLERLKRRTNDLSSNGFLRNLVQQINLAIRIE